jgi:hypothetical protein
LNSEERPTLDETLARVSAMTLDDVLALQAVGAQIIDTRDPSDSRRRSWRAASTSVSVASTQHGREPCSIEIIRS